jgi:hypothetical protein
MNGLEGAWAEIRSQFPVLAQQCAVLDRRWSFAAPPCLFPFAYGSLYQTEKTSNPNALTTLIKAASQDASGL